MKKKKSLKPVFVGNLEDPPVPPVLHVGDDGHIVVHVLITQHQPHLIFPAIAARLDLLNKTVTHQVICNHTATTE